MIIKEIPGPVIKYIVEKDYPDSNLINVLNSKLKTGEITRIINDDGYLEYVENLGWVGTIKEFHPGGGFLLYSENSGYFTFAGKSNLAKLLKIDDDISL